VTRFFLPLSLTVFVLGLSGLAFADHIAGTSCGSSRSCAGHQFWPTMSLNDIQKADEYRGTTLTGKQNKSNELLGWHGSDTLTGGTKSDILWADHEGDGQPTGQWDRIYGGEGSDFIYSARGRNTIEGGEHNDAIKARYGRGVINCGPGKDIVWVPKRRRRNWKFKNCERFEYRTESQVGHGLKPLAPITY